MNEALPPHKLEARLRAEADALTPAPPELWQRIENQRGQTTAPTRRRSLGIAATLAAAMTVSWLILRPGQATRSAWTQNGHPLALGETLVATRQPLTLTAVGVGTVELQPQSRVRVLESHKTRQRLALDSGVLKVKVSAPPRLFMVETPLATATDLGCEYTLSTGDESTLQVVSGYVELEDKNKNIALVPGGARVVVFRDGHQTLPAFEAAFPAASAYDRTHALAPLLGALRQPEDTLTLIHLLPRVSGAERAKVLDKLLTLTTLPDGVTREQVLALDSDALASWRDALKLLWGGAAQLGI